MKNRRRQEKAPRLSGTSGRRGTAAKVGGAGAGGDSAPVANILPHPALLRNTSAQKSLANRLDVAACHAVGLMANLAILAKATSDRTLTELTEDAYHLATRLELWIEQWEREGGAQA